MSRRPWGGAAGTTGTGPIELKRKSSPLYQLIGAIVICLLWNGVVGLFTYLEVTMFMNAGGWRWFLAVFLLIIWTIKMKGHINRWPDIDESFDITVTPR